MRKPCTAWGRPNGDLPERVMILLTTDTCDGIVKDEEFGGFGGPHCMVKGGYGQITDGLAANLDVRLNHPVYQIAAKENGVEVMTESGAPSTS